MPSRTRPDPAPSVRWHGGPLGSAHQPGDELPGRYPRRQRRLRRYRVGQLCEQHPEPANPRPSVAPHCRQPVDDLGVREQRQPGLRQHHRVRPVRARREGPLDRRGLDHRRLRQPSRASGDPSCAAKQHVVSGGYALSPISGNVPVVGIDEFEPTSKSTWHLGLFTFVIPGGQPPGSSVTSYAYCAKDTLKKKKKSHH